MRKILILTPDGVGSTLLQRAACAWGNLHGTWINPHELTNGLSIKDGFLQKDQSLGYSQSLGVIINLIDVEKKNMIARLARYHMLSRRDSQEDQDEFYRYLNQDFEIISCHRRNVLEYAMSWAIRDIKQTLNVYSFKQKREIHPKDDKFTLDPLFVLSKLNAYAEYERWLADNFIVDHRFYYEDVTALDAMLSRTIGGNEEDMTTHFGISLAEYCTLSNRHLDDLRDLRDDTARSLIKMRKYFLELVNKGYMPNSLPLKMNSFSAKIRKTENFDKILKVYNKWASQTNEHAMIDQGELSRLIEDDPFDDV